jgi:LptD protein/LPS transport system D
MRRFIRSMASGLLLLLALTGVSPAREGAGQESSAPPPAKPDGQRTVVSEGSDGKTLEIAAGPGSVFGKDEFILKGYVDIKFGDSRLQADFVRYVPSTREAHAEGNVILDQGPARITAVSLDYNLETETGTFYGARGYAEPSFIFEAERVEKVSKEDFVLHKATFTACTQPIPYWSFKIGHGLLRLNDYAYLHNLRFKVGRVPVFYTPYLVWPIKTDRASGLLFPEFGVSRRGGTVISNALYWAIRRNMDATFYLDYLSLAGYGNGIEYRYVPSDSGRGQFTGYYIHDQLVRKEQRPGVPIDRWVINYFHNQDFSSGWRLVGNANFISDFDYYRDYVRDLRLSTNPQALSNFYLTRNWGFYSVNLRGERREQLVSIPIDPLPINESFFASEEETIIRWIQPEAELRGRRQRLGNSPLFLTLESSGGFFRKGEPGADYGRFDINPVISSQLSPVPWLDVDANVGYRDTYYSKSQSVDLGCDGKPGTGDFGEGNGSFDAERDIDGDGLFTAADDLGCDNTPGNPSGNDYGEGNGVRDQERTVISDDPFNRNVYQAGLTLIGPKFSRVFNRPDSKFSPQYKNSIEPQIRYSYVSSVNDPERAIRFDQVDSLSGNTNRLSYSLVTRLFAKRPLGSTTVMPGVGPLGAAGTGGGGPDFFAKLRGAAPAGGEQQGPLGPPAAEESPGEGKRQLSTVEIATLEIGQDYSFLGPLSTAAALGNKQRQVSPIRATLRINPSLHASLDVRTTYDVLFNQIRESSLSANLRGAQRGFLDLTWSLSRDLEGRALLAQGAALAQPFDRSQIGLLGETNFLSRRILLGMQVNYELGDVLPGAPRLRDQRYKVGYNTQCCGVQVEILNRNFLGSSQREFRFLINLKGVGNVIDLQSGSAAGSELGSFVGGYQ